MDDKHFMEEAIKEAELAIPEGNWPIGCVIVIDGMIISRAHNQVHSKRDKLAHAEMLALESAKDQLSINKKKAILYTTYEPCPMCFGACILSRIKKIVCGIDIDNSGALHMKDHLPRLFTHEKYSFEIKRGILPKECLDVFLKGSPTKKRMRDGNLSFDVSIQRTFEENF
jgi:tRNA(adenine34) deaminase